MKMIEHYKVSLKDGFWKHKQMMNENTSMNSVWKRFYDTGRIEAFRCNWKKGMKNEPHFYWDSDVAKWIEAAAYILRVKEDKSLEEKVDGIVDRIAENQWEDGYFNIYYTVTGNKRFTERNNHELYCAGHLMEAAVAYYESTGKSKFLGCMRKYADLIYRIFVEEDSAAFTTPGHEEIEMALVRLYRCTGEKKYLELAGYFLKKRGCNDKDWWCAEQSTAYYCQDHMSVSKMDSAEGHAVRALYLYCGMADYAAETNDEEMLEACRRLIKDIINKKMYVTGGVGSTYMGESFTVPFDLPNDSAYTETCAAIALIMFAGRMLEVDNKAEYADVIERALYNGMLDGVSLDGTSFFYENPLEINLKKHTRNRSTTMFEHIPITQRVEVFECSCCPPNINRTLASIQKLAYACDGDVFYINQFMDSEMNDNGRRIRVKTDYPVSGRMEISTENIDELRIRIPYWCKNINTDVKYETSDGYMVIREGLASFDIEFEMKPVIIKAVSAVRDDRGKGAVQCGPVIYCIEAVDNGDIYSVSLCSELNAQTQYCEDCKMNVITADGVRYKDNSRLYYEADEEYTEKLRLRLIPYSCHANRGESDMLVWISIV